MTDAAEHRYSLDEMTFDFGGILAQGVVEVAITQDDDDYAVKMAADGKHFSRIRKVARMHTVSVTLNYNSPTNAEFSALRAKGIASPNGADIVTFTARDQLGDTAHDAPHAWIKKPPDEKFAEEADDRVWVWQVVNMDLNYGA